MPDSNHVCNGPCLCCHAHTKMPIHLRVYSPWPDELPKNESESEMPLPRRSVNKDNMAAHGVDWIDPAFVRDYPGIKSFLYDTKYDDGSSRITGSISLFTKAGVLTAAINDNDRNVSGFITAATWEELLFLIEEGICADSIAWKARNGSHSAPKTPF